MRNTAATCLQPHPLLQDVDFCDLFMAQEHVKETVGSKIKAFQNEWQ